MNRQQKALVVELLHEQFLNNNASFLVGYKGLTVEQLQSLRKELRSNGARLKVAKNRLMKRAIGGVEGAEQLSPYFRQQIGVVFVSQDPSAIAQVLQKFSQKHEALQLIVGNLDAHVFDKEGIIRIASLPSKEVLLAQLCGALKGPIAGFNIVLQMLILRLLWTLKQIAEKKEAQQ